MKLGYDCFSFENSDVLNLISLCNQTILTFFPNQSDTTQTCRWLVETCVYEGKQTLVATKSTDLNVQVLLHCQMWRSLGFYGCVCSFSMCLWCSSFEIPQKCLLSFLSQRKVKKSVAYWHIGTHTGQFSWHRMLVKLESKRTWTLCWVRHIIWWN